MASKLDVFNRALAIMGKGGISDPDDDASPQAIALNQAAAEVLESMAVLAHWNYCKDTATLTEDADAGDHERWGYVYNFPPNEPIKLIRLNGLRNSSMRTIWEVEGRHVLTDESPASIEYLRGDRARDYGLMPPAFREAVAYALAEAVGDILGISEDKMTRIERRSRYSLARAKFQDASEGTPPDIWSNDLIDSRRVS